MKSVKHAISYVVFEPFRAKILLVQRPADDEELPNAWGLPAGSLKDKESHEDAVVRSGREKLGVELAIVKELNEGEIEREDYTLLMKLFEATIKEGKPMVPQAVEGVTQYRRWRWGKPEELQEAANLGSLCCKLALEVLK